MSGRIAGRFTELRRLGEGGMGSVSLAHDHATGAACALKRVHVGDDARAAARLQAEFEALTRVRHPALVEVRDLVFERGAAPILVMEFVPGLPAHEVVAPGDSGAIVRMGLRVCEALAALHEAGVVHGDLKPANLLVLPESPEDVRLVDLGLAALPGHERPSFAGTPGYAAPELRRGEPATPASDLFALGATMHALLTGALPRGSHSSDVSGDSGAGPSDARTLEQAGAPEALVTTILHLMASAAAERPRDARAVVRALSHLTDAERPTLAARLDTVRIVGREREVTRVLSVHRRSDQGPGRVLVVGESGIGKSALLDDVAMRLRLEGVAVALLPASGLALHALAVTLSAAAGAEPPDSPRLALWIDEPANALGPEESNALLEWISASCRLLAETSRPPAILVDDLGRHDHATRDALRRLALRPDCPALHLWAAERPDPAAIRLAQSGEMLRLTLRPLDAKGRRRLVDARLGATSPEALAEDLDRHAEGHPGRMLARLRAIVGAGALRERHERLVLSEEAVAGLAPTPAEAEEFESRWADHAGASPLVLALALSPRSLGAETLRRVAPEATDVMLDRLCALRVLRRAGDRYRLASPALAEAWLRLLPSEHRDSMRRQLLAKAELTLVERFQLLVALGDDRAALDLAEGIEESGDGRAIARSAASVAERADDARAGQWHLRVAREARRTGHYAIAARAYESARPRIQDADVFEVAEGALVSRSRIGSAENVLEECERVLASSPPARWRAALLLLRAGLESSRGLAEQAMHTLHEARAATEATGSDDLTGQCAYLEAQIHLFQGLNEDALACADRVNRLGEGAPGPISLRAEGIAGRALQRLGRTDEAFERLARASAKAAERGEEFALLDLMQVESVLRMEAGMWCQSQLLHEKSLHLALALDLPRSAALAAANRLVSAALTGDLSRFVSRHRRARRLARRWSEFAHLDLAGRIAALAELARGRTAQARRRLERALGNPRLRADAALRRWTQLTLAQAEDESGSAERSALLLDETIDEYASDIVGALALAKRGLIRVRQDRLEAALEDIRRLDTLETSRWTHVRAHADALRAAIAIARQDAMAANQTVDEMVRRFEALPAPHELAMALLALAEVALQHRLSEAAAPQWLEQARERAERLRDSNTQIRALELRERWSRWTAPAQQSPEDMTWLAEVSVLVQHIPHLPSLAKRAMAIVCRRLDSERGVLVLADRIRQEPGARDRAPFQVVATYGEIDEAARREALGYSRKVVLTVVQSGRGMRNSDISRDPHMVSKSLMDMRVQSVLCEPLVVSGRAIGAVYLQDRARSTDFSPQDSMRVQTFAQIMAAAIEQSWKQEATQDEHDRLVVEHVSLKRSTGSRFEDGLLVGSHETMRQVNELVERVAHRDSSVLITGESGTGKELVARSIHARSPRRDGPFISTNCGALPKHLIESELFGILSDVATGVTGRPGMFQRAHGGTLLLDEIGEMPMDQQVTLLRVLQTREVSPVGSENPIPVDVRVLASTNQDLELAIREGRFRSDLFFRLHVVPIHMPPLRERRSDLPSLAHHLATQVAARFERRVPRLSVRFIDALMEHDWPGNVRELENYIERVMLFGSGDVLEPEPPPRQRPVASSPSHAQARTGSLDDQLEAIRRDRILAALSECGGNQSRAARMLGVGEQKLRFWMRRLGLKPARNI